MFFPGGSGGLSGAIPSTSQPLTVSHVASREQNFGASTTAASPFLAGNDPYSGWDSANGAYLLYAGSSIAASATESALHAIQNDFANPSSYAYIDGSGSTPGATGSTGTGTSLGVGQAASGGFNLFGLVCEAGMWSGFSGADDAAMNTNQHGTNGWNF
jgi:hypothetical protein